MGLLQKLHLVEEVAGNNVPYGIAVDKNALASSAMTALNEVEANDIGEVNVNTLISDIFAKNNLSDTAKSIYKVQELSDTLPKEMRNDVKKSTVLGILKVSGLTVEEVVQDGFERTDILNATLSSITTKCDNEVADANSKIESLKAEIEELQKNIALKEAEKEQSTKIITDEVTKVTELIKFIGGNQ